MAKEKKTREKAVDDNDGPIKAEKVIQGADIDETDRQKEATNKRLQMLSRTLSRSSKSGKALDLLEVILHDC